MRPGEYRLSYRFTLSRLRQHPGQHSLTAKPRACGWSIEFLTGRRDGDHIRASAAPAGARERVCFENCDLPFW